jgi:signal transduction histidine kinase
MSLRTRMVLSGAVAVVSAAAVTSVFFGLAVRAEMIDNADEVGEVRAEQVADLAQRGILPREIARADDLEAAVQVVHRGMVLSSTSNASDPGFFGLPTQQPDVDHVYGVGRLPIDDDGPFRVTALGARTPHGNVTVLVAVDVGNVDEVLAALASKGVIGLGVLVAIFALVLWLVVGRTMKSVEAIRRRAEVITGQHLNQRVPEPPTRDEIYRLARTLNDMLARLEGSARRQERFVADAAHELRTPLATLRTRLETALLRGEDEVGTELLQELWGETVRLGSLVDHLLLLARSDAGTLRARARPVDLDDVLGEVMSSTQVGGIDLRAQGVEPVQVTGDAALLEQVLRNLMENAVRHAVSTVDVSLSSDGGNAMLIVDDDGPGIPESERDEVFQRFVRLDDSRARTQGGVGLGLAIVAEIVRVHSGSVDVSESPAGGARLTVRLPLAITEQADVPGDPRLLGTAGPVAH